MDLSAFGPWCRIHGRGCRTPWGYDQAHTDSARPYTVEELSDRQEAPHRYAYPTAEAYVEGFRVWRAMRRDDELTPLERLLATSVRMAPLGARLDGALHPHQDHSCPIVQAVSTVEGLPEGAMIVLAQLCNCPR
ncbi:hypothetical protein [Streptomyces cahuitamycinicus]|uniref:Uncharacterized protein n=1 Tax=Streptomyces cahuitamycinicus TaxID=2070367 RepID=A0A2N8TTT4_9ACTN|nr:hypothetical protein [Streptomyces cahuitamycinicus]PNG22435.1 hypothetical protein C1J00_09525 [Streptomyces cahuitamycinicus]